ncbi:hypothetical protein ACFVUS_36395 [Nocardia sp. NPDC058058]|uniref:hypothetical protein n=1 Tax=Nocardia sp. NPDC058058 TaxID=3346317 RepID=UPI0036D9B729
MFGASPPKFVLWREVLVAYLAPALSAGIGGLLTGNQDLLLAAFTSIAGVSAVVAALIGMWLRRNEYHPRPTTPRLAAVAATAAGAATIAAVFAWLATHYLPALPDRIRIDFPIAAALAATITTWRWIGSARRDSQ